MGREVTGVRVALNKSPYAKVKPKVSDDNPKSPEGNNNEVKDFEVKECTSEVPRAENSIEQEPQDVLAVKSTNVETEKPEVKSAKAEDQKSGSPVKPAPETADVGNTRAKNTPQKPSDVTVDKEVCETPIAVDSPVSPTASNSKSSSSAKKSLPSTPLTARKNLDDEDNWSMASSTAATARTTRSRTTVAVAPTFTISERLEKRKEYYAKLEEKRKALEAEKREYEERTKEEEQAAIKQLRKNMTYKANPVPNFYYDKPPPKKELKKLPTTRAVSPKFGRRKSYSDAIRSSPEEKVRVRAARHSLGSHGHITPTSSSNLKKKDQLVGSGSKAKDRLKQVKEKTKTTPKITEQANPDIAVQS